MKTNWQDPGTTEILSSHISGLQEAVGKIEDSIGLQTTAETAIALSEVYITDLDRYRIYQAAEGKRNWVASPAPVIKKNGAVISTDFTIDYGGGAIVLSSPALSTDVFTADFTRTNSTHAITPTSIGAESKTDADAHKADYTLQVPYGGTSTNVGNTYSIASPEIDALVTGWGISFRCNADSSGASTLNWDGTGAKAIKKANGTDVTNLKNGGIYTLRYDGINFILQGEGASGNATASDLLLGKTATVDAGEIVGTLVIPPIEVGNTLILNNTLNSGSWSNTSLAKRRQILIKFNGVYRVKFNMRKVSGTGTAYTQIRKNGVIVSGIGVGTTSTTFVEYSYDVPLATGDYLEQWQSVDTGNTVDSSYLSISIDTAKLATNVPV